MSTFTTQAERIKKIATEISHEATQGIGELQAIEGFLKRYPGFSLATVAAVAKLIYRGTP